jgi:hypothetical protein
VVSAVPALRPYSLEITIGVVLLLLFGNLRGIREAGRSFAVPTYLFSGVVILMIVVGLVQEALGNLHTYDPHALPGTYPIGAGTGGLITFALILTLLRSFANGGSSLTGIEAVSDAVGAFRPPESANARQVLVVEGLILGTLVAGISWMAHLTHATPRESGVPTVLAQEAQIIFGHSVFGNAMFILVQAATALILYTGANTELQRLPVPGQLRRGRRLPAALAAQARPPAGLLQRDHRAHRLRAGAADRRRRQASPGWCRSTRSGCSPPSPWPGSAWRNTTARTGRTSWRRRFVINFSAGVLTAIVVVVFAIVKFTEGAWLVVVVFVIGVPALIRLNREYTVEAQVLERIGERPRPRKEPNYPRRTVYVLVDSFDLATLAALRYASSLRPTTLRAVHFVIDTAQADQLREEWLRGERNVVLDFIDAPDRRLTKAAAELVSREAAQPGTQVTAVLPRRTYSPLLGRLLHDRTADKIAAAVSQIPHAAATIVPFDVRSRIEILNERQEERERACQGRGRRDHHGRLHRAGRARGGPRHRRGGRRRERAAGAGRPATIRAPELAARAPCPAGRHPG